MLHKSVAPPEKSPDLNILTALELSILEVTDIYTHSCLLSKNEEPPLPTLPSLHPYFRTPPTNNPMLAGLVEFATQFCVHFKLDLAEKICRFVSCLIWWLKGETFRIGMMEEFMRRGLREISRERGIEEDDDRAGKADRDEK